MTQSQDKIDLIKKLIGKNEIGRALKIMLNQFQGEKKNSIIELQGRFSDLQKKYYANLIRVDEFNLEEAKIRHLTLIIIDDLKESKASEKVRNKSVLIKPILYTSLPILILLLFIYAFVYNSRISDKQNDKTSYIPKSSLSKNIDNENLSITQHKKSNLNKIEDDGFVNKTMIDSQITMGLAPFKYLSLTEKYKWLELGGRNRQLYRLIIKIKKGRR